MIGVLEGDVCVGPDAKAGCELDITAASDCVELIVRKLAILILMLGGHGTFSLCSTGATIRSVSSMEGQCRIWK